MTVFPLRTTRTSFSTSNLFVLFLIFPTLVFTRVKNNMLATTGYKAVSLTDNLTTLGNGHSSPGKVLLKM